MRKLLPLILFSLSLVSTTVYAQGFTPPSDGKAVVYFTRVSSYGFAVSFEYFHSDKYIGIFKGKNYIRYECDPGEQLFWASSENKEFVTADLKAGESYIVMVNIIMGFAKAHVGLEPVVKGTDEFSRAVELIKDKPPVVTSQADIDAKTKKLNDRDFISKNLKLYETEWKGVRNFKRVTSDMSVPAEYLK